MNEWKVIFATVVIFGAGVVTGGLLVNYVDFNHGRPAHHPPPVVAASSNPSVSTVNTNNPAKPGNPTKPHLPEVLSKQFVDKLDIELQLTLDQRADIEKIIANGQDDMRRAYQDARLGAREKIRKLLTPPQIKKFDELLKQQQMHPFRHPQPENKPVEPTNAPASDAPANAA